VPLGVVVDASASPGAAPMQELRRVTESLVRTATHVIRVESLEKRYGERTVLRNVGFAVRRGETHVVTGPNGSGKTTLLRLLVGLAAPSRGTVDVSLDRARVGYVGHESLLYAELTALENLDLYGRLYRVPERRERVGMLLERFGLWEARAQRVGSFSRGMSQRLALCRALLHEPELLVLDEPYSALDADGAALLDHELAAPDRASTVVVATHEPERLDPVATGRLVLGAR
jgi:heme exporter protein A